jgi:hypothetical protein
MFVNTSVLLSYDALLECSDCCSNADTAHVHVYVYVDLYVRIIYDVIYNGA